MNDDDDVERCWAMNMPPRDIRKMGEETVILLYIDI